MFFNHIFVGTFQDDVLQHIALTLNIARLPVKDDIHILQMREERKEIINFDFLFLDFHI